MTGTLSLTPTLGNMFPKRKKKNLIFSREKQN